MLLVLLTEKSKCTHQKSVVVCNGMSSTQWLMSRDHDTDSLSAVSQNSNSVWGHVPLNRVQWCLHAGIAAGMAQMGECHAPSAHAVHTQCEVLNVGQYPDPTFGPFDQFLVPYWGFFSLLCSWDVAHLNCHPLLPNVNHFYLFSIPHIEFSRLWGPREGRGDVAIHSPRTLRSLWYGLHPHHITDLARHQQVCRVHARNHHRPPLHPIRGPHHPTDHGQRIPRAPSQGTPHRRLQERSHGHRNTRSKRTLQG